MPKPFTTNISASLSLFGIELPTLVSLSNQQGDLHNDSRQISQGDVFCAVIGHQLDGRKYIENAIKQGAKIVIAECEDIKQHGEIHYSAVDKTIAIVSFYQLNKQLFELTKKYYQAPQQAMNIIGITGTNGKTTTSQVLAQLLTAQKSHCAVIGTNGAGAINDLTPIDNTTPGACELHQLFNRFKDEDFQNVAMEVSSHALNQKRVEAALFDIALFTNLSRDHLDYHGTMASYAQAKKQIFTGDNSQVAVINGDDSFGKAWLDNWSNKQTVWVYGRQAELTNYQYFVVAKDITRHTDGVSFKLVSHLGQTEVTSALLGDFNIDNLLAAITVLLIQSVELSAIADLVKSVKPIAGRMEASSADNKATAVVDYAHTPDALDKALKACRQHCSGNLFVVFGCGGDRDKGKRPLMAKAAEDNADFIVVTNDNPRTENPQSIADDILKGFSAEVVSKVNIQLDREKAVLSTLAKAEKHDMVLLAGKGHEDYVILPTYDDKQQIIGSQKINYNERELVANFYQESTSSSIVTGEANV